MAPMWWLLSLLLKLVLGVSHIHDLGGGARSNCDTYGDCDRDWCVNRSFDFGELFRHGRHDLCVPRVGIASFGSMGFRGLGSDVVHVTRPFGRSENYRSALIVKSICSTLVVNMILF